MLHLAVRGGPSSGAAAACVGSRGVGGAWVSAASPTPGEPLSPGEVRRWVPPEPEAQSPEWGAQDVGSLVGRTWTALVTWALPLPGLTSP